MIEGSTQGSSRALRYGMVGGGQGAFIGAMSSLIATFSAWPAGTMFAIWLGELISEYGIRGQGLGSRVLAVMEQGLLDRGVRRICAGVQINNPNALRFWQAHGFRICSGPIQYPDGTTAVDLVKENLSANPPPASE